MRIESPENWYEVRSLDDGIRHIQEPHILPFYRCNIWLVQGRERDLLVDSGSGLVSLSEQVAEFTRSRPRYRKGTWKRLGIQSLIVSIRRP